MLFKCLQLSYLFSCVPFRYSSVSCCQRDEYIHQVILVPLLFMWQMVWPRLQVFQQVHNLWAVTSRCHLEPLSCSQSYPLVRFRQILWTCQNTMTRPSVSSEIHGCQGAFSRCIWQECMCRAGPWRLLQDNGPFSKGWPFHAVRHRAEHTVLWVPSPVRNRAGSGGCCVLLPSLRAYRG